MINIILIVALFLCIAYLGVDLYLEYKYYTEKLHEDVQKLIKKQQEEKE